MPYEVMIEYADVSEVELSRLWRSPPKFYVAGSEWFWTVIVWVMIPHSVLCGYQRSAEPATSIFISTLHVEALWFSKKWCSHTKLRGAITQKTTFHILAAEKAPNFKCLFSFFMTKSDCTPVLSVQCCAQEIHAKSLFVATKQDCESS